MMTRVLTWTWAVLWVVANAVLIVMILTGCTTVDRKFAACLAADVAMAAPVPGVAAAGAAAGLTVCR
jgi:hypothetical protein